MDLLRRSGPVDLDIRLAAPALIGRLAVVLDDLRRVAGAHQIDALDHRLDAEREQLVEIDRPEGVVLQYVDFLLHQDGAGIETVIGPEDRQPGPRRALDDRPVDGARPAMPGEQRRVVLDRPPGRDGEKILGHEQDDERHHPEIGLHCPVCLPHRRLLVGRRLQQLDAPLQRGFLEGVYAAALAVGRAVDRDHLIAAFEQRLEDRFPECLLSDQGYAHRGHPSSVSRRRDLRPAPRRVQYRRGLGSHRPAF